MRSKAGGVRGGRRDERLARAHLADDGRASVGAEGERRPANGVRLCAQRTAEQLGQGNGPGVGGPVEGRVGLDDALRDGVLVGVDEACEVHVRVLSFKEG